MKERVPIAVVIPCYNHANVLRRTIASLQRQTRLPTEVVIVDDGSRDDVESVCREAFGSLWRHEEMADSKQTGGVAVIGGATGESGIRWTLLRFDVNRGAPAARNEGARRTQAPHILFLDADAELVPDALAVMADTLEEHPDAAFAYADFLWGRRRFRARPFNVDELRRQNYIHTSSLLRRGAFPGFDETLTRFQDWDLWLTMAARGAKGVWIPRVLYRIEPRVHGLSRWLPRIAYRIPWQRIGIVPREIRRYQEAEAVIRKKHGI
jgi:glycosyltransferase involved in cell wall biosynthesis